MLPHDGWMGQWEQRCSKDVPSASAAEKETLRPQIARETDKTPAQLAVLWAKDQPGITAPIIGPRTLEQLRHFLPVLEMKLDEAVRIKCDELVPPGSVVADFHNSAPWMKMRVPSGPST